MSGAMERHHNALDLGLVHVEGDDFIYSNTIFNLANSGKTKIDIVSHIVLEFEKKLSVAREALRDIEHWDDDLELEWDDQGNRAYHGLQDSQ